MYARLFAVLAILAGIGAYSWAQTGLFSPNQFFGGPPSGSSQDWGAPRAIVPLDLPIATTSTLGAVQPDGTTIAVTVGGVISVASSCPSGTACYTCTGSGDSTGINTALATGKTVHLLGSICSVVSDLTFTTTGQRLYCDGRTVTTIEPVASAGGFTHGILYFNTGEPGPTVEGCGLQFVFMPDTSTRASLTAYPPAVMAQNTPRFRLLHDRIAQAMVGVDMRGNSGGALIDDLEISCLSVCVWIDGSLDTVRLTHVHNWTFGLTTNQQTLALTTNPNCTPQTTSGSSGAIGLWSGRLDDLQEVSNLWLVGTMQCFQPGWGNRDGSPWLDGGTFGTATNQGYDSEQGIVMNQPAMSWADQTTNAQTLTSSNVLHFASYNGFSGGTCLAVGTVPFDVTHPISIQAGNVVTACTATTVTLTSNVAGTVSSGDTITGQNHGQGNVQVSNSYFSGALNGDSAIVLNAGVLACAGCSFSNGASGAGAQIQQSGGTLIVSDGFVDHGAGDLGFYNGSGGFITIRGMQFNVTGGGTQTHPIIEAQVGANEASIQGNHIGDHGAGSGVFVAIDVDGFHNVIGNNAPGWSASTLGVTGSWAARCAALSVAVCANNN